MPKFNTAFTCVGRGGHCTTGVALERDIHQYMDAEGDLLGNKSGARCDLCSDGILLRVLHVVRCEHVW